MKKIFWVSLFSVLVILTGCKAKELSPQQQARQDALARQIEQRDFVFKANSAQPMKGRSINLSSNYTLDITSDEITAYLPYFGRSYSAPIRSTDIGIKFESTNFDYQVIGEKSGMYEILIVPKDITKPDLKGIKLYLSAGVSGYGSLRIVLDNRQSISYYGTIE